MPDTRKLRSDAKKLIAQGVAEFERGGTKHEYWCKYGEARDLLLKHGYERAIDAKAQTLFAELIPDSKEFVAEKKTSLKQLRSKDDKIRLTAARRLCSEARATGNVYRESWLRHPETVATMLDALAKEQNPKIARELIIALGAVHQRYFEDRRIVPVLIQAWGSPDREVRRYAILWTTHVNHPDKWPKLIEILESTPSAPLLIAVLRNVTLKTPVKFKRRLQPLLVELWRHNLRDQVREELLGAIANTVDKRTVESFKDQIRCEPGLKTELKAWVDFNTSGERMKFLHSELAG